MSQTPEDHVLIDEALAGSQAAYAALVRKHQDMVARVVMMTTRRPDLVEDVVQEVFLKAFEALPRFGRRSEFTTWLYRIAVNAGLDALRKEGADKKMLREAASAAVSVPDSLIVSGQESAERMVLGREVQIEVRRALDKLSPQSRAVLALRYLEEMSTPEIARALELPEGTVRSRLHYARIELAGALSPFMGAKKAAGIKERE